MELAPQQETSATAVVVVSREDYEGSFRFELVVYNDSGAEIRQQIEFLGPEPQLLK